MSLDDVRIRVQVQIFVPFQKNYYMTLVAVVTSSKLIHIVTVDGKVALNGLGVF